MVVNPLSRFSRTWYQVAKAMVVELVILSPPATWNLSVVTPPTVRVYTENVPATPPPKKAIM